jgi:hypothetical protein
MGNAWLDFLAEERDKEENKDVPPMELSSHVRPKYDAWKEANGIESKSADKMEDKVEDKMEDKMEEEVEVVVVAKKMKPTKKGKSVKKGRKGKSVKKGKKGKRRGTRKR